MFLEALLSGLFSLVFQPLQVLGAFLVAPIFAIQILVQALVFLLAGST